MRCPVYRNLDKPFQILGFTALELIILCLTVVGGTELTRLFMIQRVWAMVLTALLALGFFWIRRSLGELFARRLFRFFLLPSFLNLKLLSARGESR
jgi:hypothetical protein